METILYEFQATENLNFENCSKFTEPKQVEEE